MIAPGLSPLQFRSRVSDDTRNSSVSSPYNPGTRARTYTEGGGDDCDVFSPSPPRIVIDDDCAGVIVIFSTPTSTAFPKLVSSAAAICRATVSGSRSGATHAALYVSGPRDDVDTQFPSVVHPRSRPSASTPSSARCTYGDVDDSNSAATAADDNDDESNCLMNPLCTPNAAVKPANCLRRERTIRASLR